MRARSTRSLALTTFVALAFASLAPVAAEETTYHFGVSPQNTNVTFESETDFETILGSTREIRGTAVVDVQGGLAQTSLEVPVESLRTGIELRDKHLRSGMWLDAKKYPTISFSSTAARKIDDTRWEISGSFSMHGESHELSTIVEVRPIPADVAKNAGLGKGDWIRITAPFEVKLSEFGVVIPKKPAQRVNDTWTVKIQVFASTVVG
jgi:polyisoprenoid-binding protein YceI